MAAGEKLSQSLQCQWTSWSRSLHFFDNSKCIPLFICEYVTHLNKLSVSMSINQQFTHSSAAGRPAPMGCPRSIRHHEGAHACGHSSSRVQALPTHMPHCLSKLPDKTCTSAAPSSFWRTVLRRGPGTLQMQARSVQMQNPQVPGSV